ncbi:18S rRNA maturation protein [Ascosphaera aggregata]|nr:18S rRNA maturation protein [Ascosphaera aggregata]
MPVENGKRKRDDAGDKSEHRKHYKRRQTSINEPQLPAPRVIKDKIRDVRRLLAKSGNLPADVRVEKERVLQQYESDLAEVEARKKRSAMTGKYHFVRFLERKTASKALNRFKKTRDAVRDADGEDSPALKELDEKVRIAEIDYNYTIYSPLTEKYISLYPKSQGSKDGDNSNIQNEFKTKEEKVLTADKPPLWHVVAQCMIDDNLQDLRDGKFDIGPDGKKNEPKAVTTRKTIVKDKKQKATQDRKRTENEERRIGGEEMAAPQKENKKDNRRMRREKERDMKNMHEKLEDLAMDVDQGEESEGGFFEE